VAKLAVIVPGPLTVADVEEQLGQNPAIDPVLELQLENW
jgi:hypothetical protein